MTEALSAERWSGSGRKKLFWGAVDPRWRLCAGPAVEVAARDLIRDYLLQRIENGVVRNPSGCRQRPAGGWAGVPDRGCGSKRHEWGRGGLGGYGQIGTMKRRAISSTSPAITPTRIPDPRVRFNC